MKKILVIGLAPLPFENEQKNFAPGMRTWQFAKPLAEDGFKVCLVCHRIPFIYKERLNKPERKPVNENLAIYSLEDDFNAGKAVQEILEEFDPSCIIGVNVYGSGKACRLKTAKPIWADLNGYFMAEAQAKAYVYGSNKYVKRFWDREYGVFDRADKFSVVSDAQRFATIGELGARGRLNRETTGYEFAHTVRNGVADGDYIRREGTLRGREAEKDDFIVLWSGGYNVWADVDTLFSGLEAAMAENPGIKFVSTGGAIEGHDEKTYARMLDLISRSRFKNRFIMKSWVPKEDAINYYFEADIGIIAEKFMYEGVFGCRNRILDWLKLGLPVLSNELCELTKILRRENIGFSFNIGDHPGLKEKILYLAAHKELLKEHGARGREYCLKNHNFNVTTKVLREWAGNPSRAPDYARRVRLAGGSFLPGGFEYLRRIVRKYSGFTVFAWNALIGALIMLKRILLVSFLAPFIFFGVLILAAAILAGDLLYHLLSPFRPPAGRQPLTAGKHAGASIIISNWNGRHLLPDCLDSVLEAVKYDGNDNEIIVVDDCSTDGSPEFVRERYPSVKVISLESRSGYAKANNIAAGESKNDIVIFLNNDMTVNREFIAPLLGHFSSPDVFAVTAKILMQERRINGTRIKETGITRGIFSGGFIKVWQEEKETSAAIPVFYMGGGSSACDKTKFLELGGFDALYRPFYYEDTDISYQALKRGWRILFEPGSTAKHAYRGTINSANFSAGYIKTAVNKNYILFVWKNITDKGFVVRHFAGLFSTMLKSLIYGDFAFITAFAEALSQLPEALGKRLKNRRYYLFSDKEALNR